MKAKEDWIAMILFGLLLIGGTIALCFRAEDIDKHQKKELSTYHDQWADNSKNK